MNFSYDVILVIVLIAGVFWLRHQNRREYATLSDQLKETAQMALNRFRLIQFGVLIIALGAVLLTSRDSKLDQTQSALSAGVALTVMGAWAGPGLVLLYRRMKELGFPSSYARIYILDRLFPMLLLGGLLASVLWRLYHG